MRFVLSSLGAKVVMAVSGLILVGYLVLHLAGNLLVFSGPEKINGYGHTLHTDLASALWAMRLLLIGAVLAHIASGLRLWVLNKRARPVGYAVNASDRSTLSSRAMAYSGILLIAFIVYHLLHFTFGVTHPEHFHSPDALGQRDVWGMIVKGFRQPAVAIGYIIGMLLVGLHLRHGVASMFQSVGVTSQKYRALIERGGLLLALLLAVGFLAIPLVIIGGFYGGAQ